MSFLKALFGRGGEAAKPAGRALGEETYKGFVIKAVEMKAGREYQLAGVIEKEIDGVMRRTEFIRADKFSNPAEAGAAALLKGQRIIDEQGEALFGQWR